MIDRFLESVITSQFLLLIGVIHPKTSNVIYQHTDQMYQSEKKAPNVPKLPLIFLFVENLDKIQMVKLVMVVLTN